MPIVKKIANRVIKKLDKIADDSLDLIEKSVEDAAAAIRQVYSFNRIPLDEKELKRRISVIEKQHKKEPWRELKKALRDDLNAEEAERMKRDTPKKKPGRPRGSRDAEPRKRRKSPGGYLDQRY